MLAKYALAVLLRTAHSATAPTPRTGKPEGNGETDLDLRLSGGELAASDSSRIAAAIRRRMSLDFASLPLCFAPGGDAMRSINASISLRCSSLTVRSIENRSQDWPCRFFT
jgi:hypothetical protein